MCLDEEMRGTGKLVCGGGAWRFRGLTAAGRKQRHLLPDYSGCDDAGYGRLSGIAENPGEK